MGQASSPHELLNQGRSLYEAGRLTAALEPISAAVDQYRAQHNPLGEAVALSNLALVQEQRGDVIAATEAIATSISILSSNGDSSQVIAGEAEERYQSALAQSLNVQARVQLAQGQAADAIATLDWAIVLFNALNNPVGVTRSQIRKAEALQTMGFHQAAVVLLQPLYEQLETRPNSAVKVSTLRNLANAYYQVGRLDQAEGLMSESLNLAMLLDLAHDAVAAQMGLANILRAQGAIARIQGDADTATAKTEQALDLYGAIAQGETASPTIRLAQVQARLNRLSLLMDQNEMETVSAQWQGVQTALDMLPPSRSGLYARMNLAQSLMKLHKDEQASKTIDPAMLQTTMTTIEQELQQAAQYAYAIGDRRAESFALGYLGEMYEIQYAATGDREQWRQAKQLTQEALLISNQRNAQDIAYQWHWQMGRLLSSQVPLNNIQADDRATLDEAIASYKSAINILKGLRQDLVTVNREVQFSFQESVEPIHRQLVDLLLKKDDALQSTTDGGSDADTIKQAQETIESLQLVELTNFLREACVDLDTVAIEQVLTQTEAAVVYPIILGDRLEIIISTPGQSSLQASKQYSDSDNVASGNVAETADQLSSTLSRVTVDISQEELEDLMGRFYDGVYNFISIGYRPLAEQAYDLLIRPIEKTLADSQVDTLVFVLDGVLRNVPMAALNDGEQFLVEKYSIALTPGIQLLTNLLASDSLQQERLSVAALGLSEAVQGFLPLPNVNHEIEQIKQVIPNTKALLNQDFTKEGFTELLSTSPSPIVHLATHGQFSSQQERTFILTWNERITIGELSQALKTGAELRQAPIELLVLSACETASGDRRAALGLAGVAIRAGARSTVASLWQVDDAAAAEMMGEFYRQIASKKVSKAEALRQAQLTILNNPQYRKHPYYWAPFVLLGNWR